jgi:hypothetical protein
MSSRGVIKSGGQMDEQSNAVANTCPAAVLLSNQDANMHDSTGYRQNTIQRN